MSAETAPIQIDKSVMKLKPGGKAEKMTVSGAKGWIKVNKVEAAVVGGGLTAVGLVIGAPAVVTAGLIDIGLNAGQNFLLGKYVKKHEGGGSTHMSKEMHKAERYGEHIRLYKSPEPPLTQDSVDLAA